MIGPLCAKNTDTLDCSGRGDSKWWDTSYSLGQTMAGGPFAPSTDAGPSAGNGYCEDTAISDGTYGTRGVGSGSPTVDPERQNPRWQDMSYVVTSMEYSCTTSDYSTNLLTDKETCDGYRSTHGLGCIGLNAADAAYYHMGPHKCVFGNDEDVCGKRFMHFGRDPTQADNVGSHNYMN